MIKQTLSKLALALTVALILSNSTHVFAQISGPPAPGSGSGGNGLTLHYSK
jgi:hypothetical protein